MKTLFMLLFHALGVMLWFVILVGYLAMIFSPFWLAKAALAAIGFSALSLLASVIVKRVI